jgi:hypothetical protein
MTNGPDLSRSLSEEGYSDNDDLVVSDDTNKESSRSPRYDASAYVLSKRRHCQKQNVKFSSLLYLYLLIETAIYKKILSVNGAGTVKPHSPVWQPIYEPISPLILSTRSSSD